MVWRSVAALAGQLEALPHRATSTKTRSACALGRHLRDHVVARAFVYDRVMPQLTVGMLAPDFDLAAHDGTRVRLSELAGSYVLLWFYPEADTPG